MTKFKLIKGKIGSFPFTAYFEHNKGNGLKDKYATEEAFLLWAGSHWDKAKIDSVLVKEAWIKDYCVCADDGIIIGYSAMAMAMIVLHAEECISQENRRAAELLFSRFVQKNNQSRSAFIY